VAGGVTELVIIVGIGIDCDDESTCCGAYKGPDSAELVDGLCSVRKFGISGAASESRRFFCTATTFGGGTTNEPRLDPLRVADVAESDAVMMHVISCVSFSIGFDQFFVKSDVCESRRDLMLLPLMHPESALDSRLFLNGGTLPY
jgi:hypothetical protein